MTLDILFIFSWFCLFYVYTMSSRNRKILALANGVKGDKNTIFLEFYSYLASLLQQFNVFSKLIDCGYSRFKVGRVFFVSVVFAFSITILLLILIKLGVLASLLISVVFSIAFGFFILTYSAKSCVLELKENSIVFIMLLHGCIQSGMSTDSACKLIEERMKTISSVFSYRLSILNARGQQVGIATALNEERVFGDCAELKSLCSSIVRFVQVGGGYSDFLAREYSRLHTERVETIRENVAKLSAKMTVPMVALIMMPCLGLMVSPAIHNSYVVLSHLFK